MMSVLKTSLLVTRRPEMMLCRRYAPLYTRSGYTNWDNQENRQKNLTTKSPLLNTPLTFPSRNTCGLP